MGYTGAMFVAAFVLSLPVLLVTAVPFGIARWLGAVPAGFAGIPAYLLIACGMMAALFLYSSADMLLIEPRLVQQHHLGRIEGRALALRSYAHWGFQDPTDEWVYALDPNVLARLRGACTPEPSFAVKGPARCTVYSRDDGKTFTSIWLEEGKLHIQDGDE